MKKLNSYTEFQSGRVYNRVYTGPNMAYAHINGKETFLVLETTPLQTVELFGQFGDPHTDDIRGETVTYDVPEIAFKEFELFQPADASEWLKKSVKVTSLGAAVEQELITREDITQMGEHGSTSPFMPTFGRDMKLKGIQCHFQVEDRTKHPLLQAVFVVWQDWETLKADFKKFGVTVRT